MKATKILLILLKMIELLALILVSINMDGYEVSSQRGVDCNVQLLTNKQTIKQHTFDVSNASLKLPSGLSWIQQKKVEKLSLINCKVCTNKDVMQLLKSLAFECTKMAQDYVILVALDRTKVRKDFKLALFLSESSRRRKGRKARAWLQDQLRPTYDVRRTIVAYGDASTHSAYRDNASIPVQQIYIISNRTTCLLKDVNAAANIRSILVRYILSGHVLESRQAASTRDQQDQRLQKESIIRFVSSGEGKVLRYKKNKVTPKIRTLKEFDSN
ncbi:hypothetical protein EDC96DRAFT_591807 [Choanephora cucurbitarum]|nr:hypothetical protein EDC96DRAFT_591807 [Choanephora cucurbitarum]